MSLDDILKVAGTIGLSGFTGSITGGIASVWRERNDKQKRLDETRRSRLVQWRADLTNAEDARHSVTTLASWSEIRAVLPDKLRQELEPQVQVSGPMFITTRDNREVTFGPARFDPRQRVLDRLAEVEREWGLI